MRDTTYDNAKGIGLILVILGHLLPFGNLQSSIIYSIHMPLFLLVLLIIGNKYKNDIRMFVDSCSRWKFCILLIFCNAICDK